MTKRAIIISLLFFPILLLGQKAENDLRLFPKKEYFKSYISDSRDIIRTPYYFTKKEWVNTALLTSAGIAIMSQDRAIYNFAHNKHNSLSNNISKYFLEPFGNVKYIAPLLGGMYLHSTLSHNNYERQTALSSAKAVIISTVMIEIPKQIFHRHRPEQDITPDATNWDGPFSAFKYRSFPSGHSTIAFSAATVIASAYQHKKWISITAYSIATLSALSRIHDNEHWASDVFFGSLTGYFIGRTIYKNDFLKNRKINTGITSSGIGIWIKLN